MISIDYADGMKQYEGQHITFSIDPDNSWWPSDTSLLSGFNSRNSAANKLSEAGANTPRLAVGKFISVRTILMRGMGGNAHTYLSGRTGKIGNHEQKK